MQDKQKTAKERQADLRLVLGDRGLLRARLSEQVVEFGAAKVTLRALPADVEAYCKDCSSDILGRIMEYQYRLSMLRFSVVGWEGVTDSAGKTVLPEFEQVFVLGEKHQVLSLTQTRAFGEEVLNELEGEVIKLNRLSVEEKKSSSSTGGSKKTSCAATKEIPNPQAAKNDVAQPAPEK